MQLFGRPLARAVCRSQNARLALQASARPQSLGLPELRNLQHPPACLRCRAKAIGIPIRPFSSQPPSKGSTASSPSLTEAPPPIEPANTNPPPDTEPPPIDDATSDLPSSQESRRSRVTQKFSEVMDTLQSRVLTASQTLNHVTGYSSIESIKADNDRLEAALATAHADLRAARAAYKSSNARRAASQREVNTLLARKESWTPTDLQRFTELYRVDHELEGEVAGAQEALTEAEAEEQSLAQRLSAGILKRYHEEQIWSDRIRRASTWGTWGLMGMNFLTFLVLQFVAEPWKRKRLVKGVVAEEKQALDEVRGELLAIKASLESAREAPPAAPSVTDAESSGEVSPTGAAEITAGPLSTEPAITPDLTPTRTWKEFLSDPKLWQLGLADLWSDRQIDLRMKDASVLALEGAVAGATVAAGIVWGLARR